MSYVLLYSGIGVTNAKTVNSVNAIISNRTLKTASSSGVILNEIAKTTSANAIIALLGTKTPSSNAIIQAHQTKAVATNAIIERIHKTAQADAVIAATRTKTAGTSAVIRSPSVTKTTSANAVIKGHQTKTTSTSAVIFGGGSLIPSNAVISIHHTLSTGSNALIKAIGLTRTLSSNASIALTRSINTSANTVVQKHQTPFTGSNAVIAKGFILRSAISDINLFAEYLRLIGILMLVDPAFQTELNTVPSQQTFTFVKKVVKGLYYVDITGGGAILTGQVKTGDGVAYNAQVNVSVRLLGDTAISATASVGTILAGAGTKELWVLTNSSGAFALSLVGTGAILVEMIPKQGVVMSQNVTI